MQCINQNIKLPCQERKLQQGVKNFTETTWSILSTAQTPCQAAAENEQVSFAANLYFLLGHIFKPGF